MISKFKTSKDLWSIYNAIDQTTQHFLFNISIVEKEDIKGLQIIVLWFHFIIGS